MNLKDAKAKVTAVENQIHGLEYGKHYSIWEIERALHKEEYDNKNIDAFLKALERSEIPKYIRFAEYLREIISLKSSSSWQKQEVRKIQKRLEKDFLNSKEIITTAREFEQIHKDAVKLSKKATKKLKRYKYMKEFYDKKLEAVAGRYIRQSQDHYFDLEVFMHENVPFLNSSKLVKKVK